MVFDSTNFMLQILLPELHYIFTPFFKHSGSIQLIFALHVLTPIYIQQLKYGHTSFCLHLTYSPAESTMVKLIHGRSKKVLTRTLKKTLLSVRYPGLSQVLLNPALIKCRYTYVSLFNKNVLCHNGTAYFPFIKTNLHFHNWPAASSHSDRIITHATTRAIFIRQRYPKVIYIYFTHPNYAAFSEVSRFCLLSLYLYIRT